MPGSPYTDQPEKVPPGSRLIRRINPRFVVWDDLDEAGNPRVTSQAFQLLDQKRAEKFGCPGPGLSVIGESLMTSSMGDLISKYHEDRGEGLAYISTNALRQAACGIQAWPTDDEAAHAIVFRLDGGKDLAGWLKQQLAEFARNNLIVPPRT